MADIIIEADNSAQVLAELKRKCEAALEACGNNAVTHAKQNIEAAGRVDTGALVNSVNHRVDDDTCYVGTNQSYAIYHEMGTGIYVGGGRRSPWAYKDARGQWHMTRGVPPVHFLKNAIADNVDEYKGIIEKTLKG